MMLNLEVPFEATVGEVQNEYRCCKESCHSVEHKKKQYITSEHRLQLTPIREDYNEVKYGEYLLEDQVAEVHRCP